jgi:hypothetical protein
MSYHLRARCVATGLLLGSYLHAADRYSRIGIYHWGGERTISMAAGVDRIASLGGSIARVAFSPRYYADYNLGGGCYPNFTLTRLAGEPDVRRVLGDNRIRVLMLTAYDGASFGDCRTHRYLNPRFYTVENVAAVQAEYREFVVHLFHEYGGSGRRFVLSNWEGDNAIYCGAFYDYVVNDAFRAACDRNYSVYYDGNAGPEQSLEGIRLWLLTREAGIREGIAVAMSLGLSGIEVLHAPEIASVRLLEERGFRSVLRDVLPAIRPDFVSYSSYESLNREDPVAALAADLQIIRTLSGAARLIVGEAGYSRVQWGDAGVIRLETVIRRAADLGIAYLICWNLNDQGGASDFGVFDRSDQLTPSGRVIERELRAVGAPAPPRAFMAPYLQE